jgi:hypothetical protein
MSLRDLKANELDLVEIPMGLEDEFEMKFEDIMDFLTAETTGMSCWMFSCCPCFKAFTNCMRIVGEIKAYITAKLQQGTQQRPASPDKPAMTGTSWPIRFLKRYVLRKR